MHFTILTDHLTGYITTQTISRLTYALLTSPYKKSLTRNAIHYHDVFQSGLWLNSSVTIKCDVLTTLKIRVLAFCVKT